MKQLLFSLILLSSCLLACQPKSDEKQNKKDNTTESTQEMQLDKFETIKLQQPDLEGGDVLMQVFNNRKTSRNFKNSNLSLKHLSEILWVAYGINRADENKKTVPSSLGLYPLQIYAFLSNGIYLYIPESHELKPIKEGDHRAITGTQHFVKDAAMNLVFVADLRKYEGKKYTEEADRRRVASLDAGHCAQNIYLYCASEQIKTVERGMVDAEKVMSILELGDNYKFIIAQSVGY